MGAFDGSELAGLGWSKLKRLGTDHGLTEAQIDRCLEQRSPKLALIELLQELREEGGGGAGERCVIICLEEHSPLEARYLYLKGCLQTAHRATERCSAVFRASGVGFERGVFWRLRAMLLGKGNTRVVSVHRVICRALINL
jgi:hypothetical protein